ncbi:MAG: hypothetical protein IJ744_10175 [Lachnospiraceae bacterium]|nr:hypothetical protein [Lachnospiraceae bacterium]
MDGQVSWGLLLVTALIIAGMAFAGKDRRKELVGEADERQERYRLLSYKIGFYMLSCMAFFVIGAFITGKPSQKAVALVVLIWIFITYMAVEHYKLWKDATYPTRQGEEKLLFWHIIESMGCIGFAIFTIRDHVDYYNYFDLKYSWNEFFSYGDWYLVLLSVFLLASTVSIALKWWFDWKQEEKDAEEEG